MLKMIGILLSSFAKAKLNSTPCFPNASRYQEKTDFGMIEVQIQDDTGNWRTCNVTKNIPAMIIAAMKQLAFQYPGKRIRAVTTDGKIVDIL